MRMNHSGLYRLIIKPIVTSSFGKELAFHGCSIGRFKQYSTTPEEPESTVPEKPKPFSILQSTLWPNVDCGLTNTGPHEELGPGMVLFKRYLNIMGQIDIINTVVRLAQGPGSFYLPSDQDGDKLGLHMTTFGRNWDPITRYEKHCRSDDGSEPPQIPPNFIRLVENAIKDAQSCFDELPSMCPDICVANFYATYGRLGLHQDCDESSDSIEKGLPVVSISIGDTAEFWYGHTSDVSKLSKVHLKSGDALIFGGESRLIYHEVKNIIRRTSPPKLISATGMRAGRLNLTFKQV